jgi:hypothetical protein
MNTLINTIKLAMPLFVALTFGSSQVMASVIISDLGSFAVHAGTTVTNLGSSVTIGGNLGVSPGTSVVGSITYQSGQRADIDTEIAAASEKTALANNLKQRVAQPAASSLDGLTFTPGVYGAFTTMSLDGILILDGLNSPNPEWIFQMPTTLFVGTGAKIILINAGSNPSVFWSVGTAASLAGDSEFLGNIVAKTAITLYQGADIRCGRVFAETGITMKGDNTISHECVDFENSYGLSGGQNGLFASSFPAPSPKNSSIPEPSTIVIFAFGLMGLALRRFK